MVVVLRQSLQTNAVNLARGVEWHLIEDDDLLGSLIADALGVGQQRRCAAHLERVIDLAVGIAVVARGRDQSGLEAGEMRFGISEAILFPRSRPISR